MAAARPLGSPREHPVVDAILVVTMPFELKMHALALVAVGAVLCYRVSGPVAKAVIVVLACAAALYARRLVVIARTFPRDLT